MNPKISIIVPVYKVEEYISETIESLLAQDYDNFEIVLIDDGSPDNSGKICDDYSSNVDKVFVYHKENGGVTSARKFGLEKSTGDWIVFVDGDDILEPNALSEWYKMAIENDADYILTPMIYCINHKCRLASFKFSGCYSPEEFRYLLCNEYLNYGIGGRMISKKLFSEESFSTPKKIVNNEDFFMNIKLSKNMKRFFVNSQRGYYKYIKRENSVSQSIIPESSWESAYNEVLKMLPEYGPCIGMYMVLSIYHRVSNKKVDFKYAQSWLKKLGDTRKYPVRLRLIIFYINNPNKICYLFMRIFVKIITKLEIL